MNISGMARGYMAKHFRAEDFLIHVSKMIERQLQEWNNNYQVIIMKFDKYEWNVKIDDVYYTIDLTEDEINELKERDPYALDRKLWKDLQSQDLEILKGYGNYIDFVI